MAMSLGDRSGTVFANSQDEEEDYGWDDDLAEEDLRQLEANVYSLRPALVSASASIGGFSDKATDVHMQELIPQAQQNESREWISNAPIELLKAEVYELREENAKLKAARDQTLAELSTARGEIAIVRSHMAASAAQQDQVLQNLMRIQESSKEKYASEVADLRNEIERLKAERKFMERDLKELMDKMRAIERKKAVGDGSPSPRKDRGSDFRDGFDYSLSPTKLGKRRRKQTTEVMDDNHGETMDRDSAWGGVMTRTSQSNSNPARSINQNALLCLADYSEDKFALYNYSVKDGGERVFDVMARHMIQLEDDSGGVIYDGTLSGAIVSSVQGDETSVESLVDRIMTRIVDIWNGNVVEDQTVFVLLLEVLKFAIGFESRILQLRTLQSIVVTCQETFVQLESHRTLYTTDTSASTQLQILSVLETALCSAFERDKLYPGGYGAILWRSVSIDFVLRLLSSQRVTPRLALKFKETASRILLLSSFQESIGPLVPENSDQLNAETTIVNDLCKLLVDDSVGLILPRESSESYEHEDFDEYEIGLETIDLRLQIIRTLGEFSRTTHGHRLMGGHVKLIHSLLCCLSEQIDFVYSSNFVHGNDTRLELISLAVKLLHQIRADDSQVIGAMAERSTAVKSALIVGLSRLAFAERSVYHEGIDEETVECARRLLESEFNTRDINALYAAVNETDA